MATGTVGGGINGSGISDYGQPPDSFAQDLYDKIDAMKQVHGGKGSEAWDYAGGTLGAANLLDPYTYKPDQAAWDYKYGIPQQYQDKVNQAMGYGPQSMFTPGARAAEIQSRGQQQNALAMLNDYAQGNKSVARDQGQLERQALASQVAGQIAGHPYDPAAMRGGQMAYAKGAGDLGARTQLAAMQEKLAAQNALLQGAGALRGQDISQFGQESAIEKSLRDYQIQKDTQAQAWQKLGLGEKAAGYANQQDWEKQQIARQQYLQNMGARFALGPQAGSVGQGTDWGAAAGGIGTALASIMALFASDERAKTGIVPSGAQCKQALASGNPALASFLQAQASSPSVAAQSTAASKPAGPSPAGGTSPVPVGFGMQPAAPAPASVSMAKGAQGVAASAPVQRTSLPPQSLAPGADSAKAPAPGLGGVGTQQAQPGDPNWSEPAMEQRARGIYGHTLNPTTPWSVSPSAQNASGLSILDPSVLPVEAASSSAPAGGGSWQQTTSASAPAGSGSWQQTPSSAGASLAVSPLASGALAPGAAAKGYDIGPTGMGYDIGPTGKSGQTGQQMQPFGIGSFNGLIYSDERCKIISDKLEDLETQGRSMTPEYTYLRNSLDKLRESTASSAAAPGMMGASSGGPAPYGTQAPKVWDLGQAPESAELSHEPTHANMGSTGAGATAQEVAAGAEPAASGMNMQAMGGIGKGIGGLLGALLPKPQQPGTFHDVGTVPMQMTPNVMGGIAQSLLSDVSAKRDMQQPPDRAIDGFLDKIEPTQFNYKEPFASQYGAGRRTGVIAQDVAKSQLGSDMVVRDPQSGLLMLDTQPQKFNPLVLASLAHLAHRIEKLEK